MPVAPPLNGEARMVRGIPPMLPNLSHLLGANPTPLGPDSLALQGQLNGQVKINLIKDKRLLLLCRTVTSNPIQCLFERVVMSWARTLLLMFKSPSIGWL